MTNPHPLTEELGPMRAAVDLALARLAGNHVIERLWNRDHSVWKPFPLGIADRLGWLDIADRMVAEVGAYEALTQEVLAAGYERVILLGMGGSSVTAEFYRRTFGVREGFLDLDVIDVTDGSTIREWSSGIDPKRSLWLVATKSGETVETLSLLKYFFGQVSAKLGEARAGEHFIALTDRGTVLAELAADWGFRRTIFGDPDVGGPYSALSPYGLVPAALLGLDLGSLLSRARDMAALCGPEVVVEENPGARLGVIMGELARAGRDKLTLLVSKEELGQSFGDWVEQLVAVSTGKEGRGILPVVGEPITQPSVYGPDRFFVCLNCGDETHLEGELEALSASGHPLIQITLRDPYDLGGQLFLWQLATAVASHQLQVNPFDQPDVESSKDAARQMVEAFKAKGERPQQPQVLADGVFTIYGDVKAPTPLEAYKAFLYRIRPPEYLAIQAFLQPSEAVTELLALLRTRLRDELGVAVTIGYGPRFLHTTGQLHKGDAGHGRFLQLRAGNGEEAAEVLIPDEMGFQQGVVSFGVLEVAQAMGDLDALSMARRKAIGVHLGSDVVKGLSALIHAFDAHRTSSIPPLV